MDRRQARARFLIAALLPVLLAAAVAAPDLPIKESRWLAPDGLFEGLTRQPTECFKPPKTASERRSAAIGRAAFRAPLLLGGQAARVGLSCSSCHRNGRGNSEFTFPAISGHPGTADVTSSLMSKRRGDGAFNPKAIPDLAGVPSKLKISRDPARKELRRRAASMQARFIRKSYHRVGPEGTRSIAGPRCADRRLPSPRVL